ncbi:MAG: hypothetical protein IKY00_04505 [Clostridia bacterium]|nr:hypothetical protein [Clostridia bacterium]
MDYRSVYELYLIRKELDSIIKELDSISYGIRYGFKGIGNETCASAVQSVASDYRGVLRFLNNVDVNNVSEQ